MNSGRTGRRLTSRSLVPWILHPRSLQGSRYEVIKEGPPQQIGHLRDPGNRNFEFCRRVGLPKPDSDKVPDPPIPTLESIYYWHIEQFSARENNPVGRLGFLDDFFLTPEYNQARDYLYEEPDSWYHRNGQSLSRWLFSDIEVRREITVRWADVLHRVQDIVLEERYRQGVERYPQDPNHPHLESGLLRWPTSEVVHQSTQFLRQSLEFAWQENLDYRSPVRRLISTEEELDQEEILFLYWFAYFGNIIAWRVFQDFFDNFIPRERTTQVGLRNVLFWIRLYPEWLLLDNWRKASLVLEYFIGVGCDIDKYPFHSSLYLDGVLNGQSATPHFLSKEARELALLFRYKFQRRPHSWRILCTFVRTFIRDNIVISDYRILLNPINRSLYPLETSLHSIGLIPPIKQLILSYLGDNRWD